MRSEPVPELPMDATPHRGDSLSPPAPATPRFSLPPSRLQSEDILFCVDVDFEARAEMKVATASSAAAASGSASSGGGVVAPRAGRPAVTRLDVVKQALLLFVYAKLSMSPEHRFAFASLGQSVSMVKRDFSSDVGSAMEAVRSLAAAESRYGVADLTQLFKIASHEAKRAESQGRLLRVVLIYCRSSVKPQHQWPIKQKHFTMDVMYLHDKPSTDNCPQKVYDALVDALEHVSQYEGYILETGQGLARVPFRQMCILLSHPLQRCMQDDLDIPKPIARKAPPSSEASQNEDVPPVASQ